MAVQPIPKHLRKVRSHRPCTKQKKEKGMGGGSVPQRAPKSERKGNGGHRALEREGLRDGDETGPKKESMKRERQRNQWGHDLEHRGSRERKGNRGKGRVDVGVREKLKDLGPVGMGLNKT